MIYANLDPDGVEDERIDPARGAARRTLYQRFSSLVADDELKVERQQADQLGVLPPPVRQAVGVLAEPIPRNAQGLIDFDMGNDFVLDVEVLEALLAIADRYPFPGGEAQFVTDEDLLMLAGRFEQQGIVASRDLLEAVFRTARSERYNRTRLQWAGRGPRADIGGGGEWETSFSLLCKELFGLREALPDQPGLRAEAKLVPVEIDGQGEYAVYIRTEVRLDAWSPGFKPFGAFLAELFNPEMWPKKLDFWCSMVPAQHSDGTFQKILDARPGPVSGYSFGNILGPVGPGVCPRTVLEGVYGPSGSPGIYPDTRLVFADSAVVTGGDADYYLEYRLEKPVFPPVNPSRYLEFDDGVIHVSRRGNSYKLVVSKLLYLRDTQHTTQGEVLAEHAVVSTWADVTRRFLLSST